MLKSPWSVLFCSSLTLAAACGDDGKKGAAESADAGGDAATSAGSPDAGTGASDGGGVPKDAGNGCPESTECVSPQGVFLCERPGREIPLCTATPDCPFGTCFPLSGQGVCVQTCTPDDGFPATTAITGVVVEFEAGKGLASDDEPSLEKPLSGVSVCVQSTAIKTPIPCATTGADGKFELAGLPPNRSLVTQVGALVTFEKDGYLKAAQGVALGGGSQMLGTQVRLMATSTAQGVADTLGAALPSDTTGWVEFAALTVNKSGVERALSTFAQGKLELMTLDGVAAVAKPASGAFAGAGPFYADEDEAFAAPSAPTPTGDAGPSDAGAADAGTADAAADGGSAVEGSTSIAGFGFFTDVPAGMYSLTFKHPTLDCGTAVPATVLPGFVLFGVGPLCGAGVRRAMGASWSIGVALAVGLLACGDNGAPPHHGGTPAPDAADTLHDTDDASAPDAALPDAGAPPDLLSATGLYRDVATGALGAGVRAYAPRGVLWADYASKERYVLLPEGSQIDTSDMDVWQYPAGTKLWKEFGVDGVRLETRLLEKLADGSWKLVAYLWREDQSDAEAAPKGAKRFRGTTHDVPSTNDCKTCHRGLADMVLGFSAVQLDHDGEGVTLVQLASEGRLSVLPQGRLVVPGSDGERDALLYLHANCGHCHNERTRIADVTNVHYWLRADQLTRVEDTRTYHTAVLDLAKAGTVDATLLLKRMVFRGQGQMPPLAAKLVDDQGVALVRAFLSTLHGPDAGLDSPDGGGADAGSDAGSGGG